MIKNSQAKKKTGKKFDKRKVKYRKKNKEWRMAMNEMEKVMELLEEITPDADFRENTALVDEGILTSFELVQLVTRIGEEFDV